MLIKSKIAVVLAIVLGTTSTAMATAKHPIHRHQATAGRVVPAAATFGSAVVGTERLPQPIYFCLQRAGDRHACGPN